MIHVEAPTRYRHWTGRMARLRDADRLETVWPDVTAEWWDDGYVIYRIPRLDGWIHLGFAPASRTRWRRFWRHWHHGRLMGYPRLSVLAFCLTGIRRPHKQHGPMRETNRPVQVGIPLTDTPAKEQQ